MECRKIIKLIPDYLENTLSSENKALITKHLTLCPRCFKEKELYEKSWQLISQLQEIEPEAGFETRFWNRLVSQTVTPALRSAFIWKTFKRWSVVLTTVAVIIICAFLFLPVYFQTQKADLLASKIYDEEIILVENIDLLENFEVIEQIDLLEDLDLIENLDTLELDRT
jgi:hypothetical protein